MPQDKSSTLNNQIKKHYYETDYSFYHRCYDSAAFVRLLEAIKNHGSPERKEGTALLSI
jgi:hypothetical protein